MQSDEIIEKIRAKLKESDASKRSCLNIFQFYFTDAQGTIIKNMVFDFKELNIYDGVSNEADTTITVSDEDFYNVGCQRTTFDELLDLGKVSVKGDLQGFKHLVEKFRIHAKSSDELLN